MFHRSAFKPASFTPLSWRGNEVVAPPAFDPNGPVFMPDGRPATRRKKKRGHDDEEVLLFAILS